jgi:hypothetical protein
MAEEHAKIRRVATSSVTANVPYWPVPAVSADSRTDFLLEVFRPQSTPDQPYSRAFASLDSRTEIRFSLARISHRFAGISGSHLFAQRIFRSSGIPECISE